MERHQPLGHRFRRLPEAAGGLVAPLLAGLPRQPVALSACFAIAGLGSEFVRLLERAQDKANPQPHGACRRLEVMSDLGALVETCLAERDGLVLIAGTGSVCVGVRHAGAAREKRSGRRPGRPAGPRQRLLDRPRGACSRAPGARPLRPAGRTLMLVSRRLGVPPQEVAAHLDPPAQG